MLPDLVHTQVSGAGGVLFSDGSAHPLSEGLDVGHEVLHLRQPDYVTPGVMLMRWEAFLDVGGLDPQFGLGSYGDADLAMAMRQRGYQVCCGNFVTPFTYVYCLYSRIVHLCSVLLQV